jgi:C-terminal processing protease CtpA/Prc
MPLSAGPRLGGRPDQRRLQTRRPNASPAPLHSPSAFHWAGRDEYRQQSGYPDSKRLFPGSPAKASGPFHHGDRVLAVARGNHAFTDTRDLSLAELVQTIRGQSRTTVRLQMLPTDTAPGATPKAVTLTRAQD